MTRRKSFLLVGAGNVGRRFLEVLVRKGDTLRGDLGLDLVLVGIADTSGVAICRTGLEPAQAIQLKDEGRGVADYPRWGQRGMPALDMVREAEASLLLEASPANLEDGQPGLSCMETALSRGLDVVTANKAPLVLAFPHLLALAKKNGASLRFDATVAGGLPAVNLGQRDLAAAEIHRLEGILNLTTNYILTRMANDGLSYEQALADAQEAGHAEADPSLDVEGWDAASKLVILAHSVLGQEAALDNVAVEGILGVTPETMQEAAGRGKRVKLVATAEQEGTGYSLTVRPLGLDLGHPLAQLGPKQMGIVYHTDIMGTISAAIVEEIPMPTASAMLRDVVMIHSGWS